MAQLTGFKCFQIYLSLKAHFNRESFDFTSGIKASASMASYEKRRDRFVFERMAKHRDAANIMLANFVADPTYYIGSEVTEDVYVQWKKRQQSLTYVFTTELSKLDDDFDSNFQVRDGQHPRIIRLFLGRKICIETLCILMSIIPGYIDHVSKKLAGDPVFEPIRLKVVKYLLFLKPDGKKFRDIVREKFA